MYQAEAEDDADDKPNKCKICLYYTWKVFTLIFSHIFLVSLVIAYCYLGAHTFERLESQHERDVKMKIPKIRENVTDDIWNMTKFEDVLDQEVWTSYVRVRLKTFEQSLLTAMKKDGWDGSEGKEATQWTFSGALFYSIIVITTIGYGHIAPKTYSGKVVTIFYAILGIPLMLLCLSNIGDIMAHSFRFLYWRVCCYMCTRKPKRQPSRRGRSIRSAPRSTSGGRYSNRSRGQSFRQTGIRTSTRSADSALGLSESMTRSSYSDTECKYNEERETNFEGGHLRSSQHSRYSDTAVPSKTGDIASPTSNLAKARPEANTPYEPPGQVAVLFNKYALDRDESMRVSGERPERFGSGRSTSTLPRQKSHGYAPSAQYQGSPYAGSLRRHLDVDGPEPYSPQTSTRSSRRVPNSSPRIMTPMGFAVPRQRLSRLREDANYDYDYEYEFDSENEKIKPVPIWLCVCLVVSYIIGGAFLFHEWEKWPLLDSAYFCFITLTTIGFGDFVPAQKKDRPEISIALCSLYLLFGIALLAMSFNLVQEEVINNVKSVAKRLGIIKDEDEEE